MVSTKKNKVKISVIMPVYNVEKFVDKAIKSVLEQTLKEIELLVVDDGSTDNSGSICDKYAKNDDRMIVIHKENGGAPTARNVAIEMAKGEFLYFIDSDDWIEKDYLEKMYDLMKKYDADLIVTGFMMEYFQNGRTVTYSTKSKEAVYLTQEELRKNAYKYFDNSLLGLPWNKLFRRKIIIDENIRFPKTKWDDMHFNLDYLMNIKSMVVSSMAKYYWYRSRAGAETMIIYGDPKLFRTRLSHYKHILDLYKHWDMLDDKKSMEAIDSFFIGRVFQCIQELSDSKNLSRAEKRKQAKQIINNSYVQKALKNASQLSAKIKILVWPMKIGNVSLCLFYGNIINFVRRNFQGLFIRLKEKEVHGR